MPVFCHLQFSTKEGVQVQGPGFSHGSFVIRIVLSDQVLGWDGEDGAWAPAAVTRGIGDVLLGVRNRESICVRPCYPQGMEYSEVFSAWT